MTTPKFASTGDMAEKTVTFARLGEGLYAYTAGGDPNTGIVEGSDCCMVIDAQATPQLASKVIERVRSVTDKPIAYVVLSHYHAVRVLGASAFKAREIIASDACRAMIVERGQQDWDSEFGRFPRLFRGAETIPGLTWPTITFPHDMTLWLGQRVSVTPDLDSGEPSVEGVLHRLDRDSVAILRHDPRVDEVCVHFPRVGYRIVVV